MPRLALLLTTLIWGATFPATKAALEQISPLSFLLLRFFLGTLLILLWFAVSLPLSWLRIANGWTSAYDCVQFGLSDGTLRNFCPFDPDADRPTGGVRHGNRVGWTVVVGEAEHLYEPG